MEKKLKNFKLNLTIMIICMILFIVTNLSYFITNIIGGLLCLVYLLGLINLFILFIKNNNKYLKLVNVIGICFILFIITEPYTPFGLYDAVFRVCLLFNFVGNILLIIDSHKIKKNIGE